MSEYIRPFPKGVQAVLRKVRDAIQSTTPDAVETISYGMPAFRYKKRILAYFAAWKHHIGFYPPAPASLKKQTEKYVGPKGNLQFPLEKPIPYDLVKKIVKVRMSEITAKK